MRISYIISCEEDQKDLDRDKAKKWKDIGEARQHDDSQKETDEWERKKKESSTHAGFADC